jgi:hypothetical protein
MSDTEHSEVESEDEHQHAKPAPKRATGGGGGKGLDDAAKELLESNRQDRLKMEEEIKELKKRNQKRKKDREEYEKRIAEQKKEEEERRKVENDEKRKKKDEEEQKKQSENAKKNAEFEKLKNPGKINFVITRKEGDDEEGKGRKSREQLIAEKKAILKQRIDPLNIDGLDSGKLKSKAEELQKVIYRLEGDRYDLEKRFTLQQADMNELSERVRSAVKVGKGGLKREKISEVLDINAARFTGTPAKIEMFSKYERQKDKRKYGDRKQYWSGPQFILPPERIIPSKGVIWGENGLPVYVELAGGAGGEGEHHEE